MFSDEIRRAVEASPRSALPQVAALLWRAYGAGQVTEAEAEALSVLIDARRVSEPARSAGQRPNPSRTTVGVSRVGSRPRSPSSMERRRRWAASGPLPVGLACRFTVAEIAVLGVVASAVAVRGDCRMPVGEIAGRAGVSETTVRNAIREARKLGLLTVEERRVTGFRNLPNVVRIVSPEWLAWIKRGGRGGRVQIREGHGLRVDQEAGVTAGKWQKGFRDGEGARPRHGAPTSRNAGPWRRSAGPAGR